MITATLFKRISIKKKNTEFPKLGKEGHLSKDNVFNCKLLPSAAFVQIEVRKTFTCTLRRPPEFLRLPKPQIIVPFSQTAELRLRGSPGGRMVEYYSFVRQF